MMEGLKPPRLPLRAPRRARAALFGAAGLALGAQTPLGTLIAEQSRTTFTVNGAGARAMGLGGAFIAVADDATAVSFNPAGLAQLLQPEVSLVGRGLSRKVGYEDFETSGQGRYLAATDTLSTNRRFDPIFFSATAPLHLAGRNLALQLSVQRVFALNEDSRRSLDETPLPGGTTGPSHLSQTLDQTGQIDAYAFALAYELSQRVLVGVSYQQWRGRWDLSSGSVRSTAAGDTYVRYQDSNALDGDNFNLGLIWRWPTWSLGIVRRTGFHAEYTFSARLDTNLPQGGIATAPFTTGLHWPAGTGVGFAYRPSDRWLLTADVVHTLWSTMRYMSSSARFNGQSFFDFDKGARTPNATDFHVGAEFLHITTGGAVIPLRMGLSREPQPVVDGATGAQRVMKRVSLGTGLKWGRLTLDGAYRYGWASRRASQFLEVDQIRNRMTSKSIGTERIDEHRLDLSVIVQFDRGPVERALRHLFVGD